MMQIEEKQIRSWNRRLITQNSDYHKAIKEIQSIEHFLDMYGYLSFGRDYIQCDNHVVSLQTLLTSAELTVGSIITCCESGCFADANTLLRKYRDDLLFYLYLIVYDTNSKQGNREIASQMKEKVSRWIHNKLKYLSVKSVTNTVFKSPQVQEAAKKYNLESAFVNMGDKLDDFVHGNGIIYYNRNVCAVKQEEIQKHLNAISNNTRYITAVFMFLLTICSPLSIMATDYCDYLDASLTPPDGVQYCAAPFVVDFLKHNIDLIDDSCIDYLRATTIMDIE